MAAPKKQGLYDPINEHDACGIGFIAHIKGHRSHAIIEDSLELLRRLDHRGACGCEVNTGDGAGILFQKPHKFFIKIASQLGFELPKKEEDYGVGMVFLSPDAVDRQYACNEFERIVKEEGQVFLGWRDVPTENASLGPTALAKQPFVRQIFIKKGSNIQSDLHFERKLYVIRKFAEHQLRGEKAQGGASFYVASLSYKTIVYKGMLLTEQVMKFYPELGDKDVESALAIVHSRFSTNTFPNWDRAQALRYVAHNGEINTLRGNVNWMRARQALCATDAFGDDMKKLLPLIDESGSDSAMFDNCLEFLTLAGRSLPHAMMMMVPEPWSGHESMSDEKKAFYEFHSCLMEPWDGPASMTFTDGVQIGACLDRNGLRPSRYYITKDDRVILASEVGVVDVPTDQVVKKGRLEPGRMFLVDTKEGRIISDEEIKHKIATEKPYRKWLNDELVDLEDLADPPHIHAVNHETILMRQQAFGYSYEDLSVMLAPMGQVGVEPIGAMGTDTPLAVLSEKSQPLYSYFKQLFAQVTNPPIDCIREEIVTSTTTTIGSEKNLCEPDAVSCRHIRIQSPILTNEEFEKLRHVDHDHFKARTLPILYTVQDGVKGLKKALDTMFRLADRAINNGHNIIVLSDRGVSEKNAPIPALLAVAGLHHHLIRQGTRTKVGIILESGEPREVHHFAVLLGYGVSAINPYLAFETLDDLINQGLIKNIDHKKAVKNFSKANTKGVVKTMSKMGISTIQSYRGAQIFEAIGLNKKFINKYFTLTPSRIGGIGLKEVALEVEKRHRRAFPERTGNQKRVLDAGGEWKWRKDGEFHIVNPETIHKLQLATRTGSYKAFKDYSSAINDRSRSFYTIRGLMEFNFNEKDAIPLDQVEPVESIVKRFKTGAMSYGSISKEAHESLAIAMNRIGGKSNTGEGGEDPERFIPLANGDSKRSAIKQVASGRFGVTSQYLNEADEIQIKMAQGAKPGEGGQLPGQKVYPWIAKVRHSTPGVGLISPPPHHDIYSIEDLAELIHDLKNANTKARINVKLVSEVGVGTIAAGVAKAHADVVLISGYDGGTGASPLSSLKHAGAPWELGLAETHQTLLLNNLRSRITVETDGQLKTGRDVAIAALLGAEEFGFATSPLIVLGCIMMRVCHLNTCPVGVATQDPTLREKFTGDPAHVVNFMKFIAEELREIMAKLGFRTINEMIGRSDKINPIQAINHWKAGGVDISPILFRPKVSKEVGHYKQMDQDHGLDKALDNTDLLAVCKPLFERGEKIKAEFKIRNVNRVVGTILGSEITKKFGQDKLEEDHVHLKFYGSAGQSIGAFSPQGLTLELEGDANDYFGKGLCGSKLIVYPPKNSIFKAEENIIIGNVAFYGAIRGTAYINGIAGERFCVRNSGAETVVEGVGDHCCEYMTGGKVVILGNTGRNFAAGMSGGTAYILDTVGDFKTRCNMAMVELEPLTDYPQEVIEIKEMIERHVKYTGSVRGKQILDLWDDMVHKFVRVIPKDYKRMLIAFKKVQSQGLTGDEANMAAFEANINDTARVGGN
jgi:glutamate synthase domain-containing protein 2/glutamate synthase domain-containing protein 1/glutamate synthase domain-containing protein 3